MWPEIGGELNLVICHSQHKIAKFVACDISCIVVQLCHMQ